MKTLRMITTPSLIVEEPKKWNALSLQAIAIGTATVMEQETEIHSKHIKTGPIPCDPCPRHHTEIIIEVTIIGTPIIDHVIIITLLRHLRGVIMIIKKVTTDTTTTTEILLEVADKATAALITATSLVSTITKASTDLLVTAIAIIIAITIIIIEIPMEGGRVSSPRHCSCCCRHRSLWRLFSYRWKEIVLLLDPVYIKLQLRI